MTEQAKTYADSDEGALILAFLEAKLASAYRKLRYAGFSSSGSMRALRRYSERAEELDGEEERL